MRRIVAFISAAFFLLMFIVEGIGKVKDILELPEKVEAIITKVKPVSNLFTPLEWFLLACIALLLAYRLDLHRAFWQAFRARIWPSTFNQEATPTPLPPPTSPDLPDTPLAKFVDRQLASMNEPWDYLDEVGNLFSDIRQRAVLGTIQVWGRENCPIGQRHTPVTLIPESHWKVALIDITSFLSDAEIRPSVTKPFRTAEPTYYSDLHLNHRQIEEAWPQVFVSLGDALKELYDAAKSNAVIGIAVTKQPEDKKLDWLASVVWGKIPLQVKYKISNLYEPLPKEEQRGRYVRFHDGKPTLVYDHQGKEEVTSTDIAILRSDLTKAIAFYRG